MLPDAAADSRYSVSGLPRKPCSQQVRHVANKIAGIDILLSPEQAELQLPAPMRDARLTLASHEGFPSDLSPLYPVQRAVTREGSLHGILRASAGPDEGGKAEAVRRPSTTALFAARELSKSVNWLPSVLA